MKRRDFAGLSLLALGSIFIKSFSSPKPTTASSQVAGFFVTTTTFFPYPMSKNEFRTQLSKWKNNDSSYQLMLDMKNEGKILSYDTRFFEDKIVTCFEFENKEAWKEYSLKFSKVPNNSDEIKKQLGFTSTKEFKKTTFA